MRHLLDRLTDEYQALIILREQLATAYERQQHHRVEALTALVEQHESTVAGLERQYRDARLQAYRQLKDEERRQFAGTQAQA